MSKPSTGRGPTRKAFADHSARWQKQALRDGIDPKRWDAWRKLSASSRKVSDPRKYAQGVTVADQRREARETAARNRLIGALGGKVTPRMAGRIAREIPARDQNRIIKMGRMDVIRFVTRKAGLKPRYGERNPYWYHLGT